MKLIDAIKNKKGNPYFIPDCSRSDLPELFKELGFRTGAEVGVALGFNLEEYCKAGFKMYGIDPWSNADDGISNNRINLPTSFKTVSDVYDVVMKRLSPYSNCTIIRKTSLDALKDIQDRSLDFAYIDGNHKYGYVAMDLMAWTEKVKKGGIVAGHDYYYNKSPRSVRQVKYAVDGFMKSFDINNWYVLGSKEPSGGERFDKSPSFIFIKHW